MESKRFSLYQSDGLWGIVEDASNDNEVCFKSYCGAELVIDRMNELSEQIRSLDEQLKNAKPQFEVGQEIWCASLSHDGVYNFVITSIDITIWKTHRTLYYFGEKFWAKECEAFATREEAEKRMAELKGEGK